MDYRDPNIKVLKRRGFIDQEFKVYIPVHCTKHGRKTGLHMDPLALAMEAPASPPNNEGFQSDIFPAIVN